MSLEWLEERMGYRFGDRGVLLQALTHTSYGHEFHPEKTVAQRDNERLEFLGDAILDVVVSDLLLEAFPSATEGQLSKMRAAVVNEKMLAEIARTLSLSQYLRLGRGEIQSGGAQKPSILSSALEALIAAIYLDGGFNAVYPVVRHLMAPVFSQAQGLHLGGTIFRDYKTELQEKVQARWKVTPTYHLIRAVGPDHSKVFEVEVRMGARVIGTASGVSKKEAEQNAARMALLYFDKPGPAPEGPSA